MDDEVYDEYIVGNIDELSLEDIDVDVRFKLTKTLVTAIKKYDYFNLIGQTIYDLDDWNATWANKV